jgi:hypothetical protein
LNASFPFFWTAADLHKKLEESRTYYNAYRVHASLGDDTPIQIRAEANIGKADLCQFQWKSHCRGLVPVTDRWVNINSPYTAARIEWNYTAA